MELSSIACKANQKKTCNNPQANKALHIAEGVSVRQICSKSELGIAVLC